MPQFQFTPILTVETHDDGTLNRLSWDWAESGQGEWNPVTLEHDHTSPGEQVCKAVDGWGDQWVPAAVRPFDTGPLHDPIDARRVVLDRVRVVADALQAQADAQAQAANPTVPKERMKGHDTAASALTRAVEELAEAFGLNTTTETTE